MLKVIKNKVFSKFVLNEIQKHDNKVLTRALTEDFYKSSKLSYNFADVGNLKLLGSTIYDRVELTAKSKPDVAAFTFSKTRAKLSFLELKQRIDEIAQSLLQNFGFKSGDRLAVIMPNIQELVLIVLAAASIGVVVVLLNPAYKLTEIGSMLQKTKCRGIVITDHNMKSPNDYEILKKICPELLRNNDELSSVNLPDLKYVFMVQQNNSSTKNYTGTRSFDELMKYDKSSVEKPYVDLNDDFAMIFTSGSSGFPKCVPFTHHAIVNAAYIEHFYPGCSESNRCVSLSAPLFHILGLCNGIISAVTNGISMVIPDHVPNTLSTLKSIQDEKCTALKGSPLLFIDLLNQPDLKKFDLSSLESIMMVGSVVPKDLLARIKYILDIQHAIVGYNLTEAGCIASLTRTNDPLVYKKHPFKSIGKGSPFCELKIIDPDTNRIVPRHVDGEICLRGYNVMKSYYNDSEKTAEIKDQHGWLKTGDIGCMDDDDFVYFKSRAKELVVRHGTRIYPVEVEEFLRTNPKILDCYVFGVTDKNGEEELYAFVQLRPSQNMTPSELKEFCRDEISFSKIPKYIRFVESFPISASGKCQKFKLLERVMSEKKHARII